MYRTYLQRIAQRLILLRFHSTCRSREPMSNDNQKPMTAEDAAVPATEKVSLNCESNVHEEMVEDSNDLHLSKRFKRSRRRGRLHKRQVAETSVGECVESKRPKNDNIKEEDNAGFGDEVLNETDYYFENGLRKVYPYPYTYLCYCKERWKGRSILQMLSEEFLSETKEFHKTQIERGAVKVNGKPVSVNRMLQGKNELISNETHRHELPVTAEPIKIIDNTSDYLVIDKPASIPVHPCGRYRHNTVTFILGKEHGIKNLRTIYRLDRLTSGLLIFGKNHKSTNRIMDCIKERTIHKTYLCKVEGEFPSGTVECKEPLDKVHAKIGTWRVKPGGKDAYTTFERLSFDGKTSIVKCMPHTGRTHQIRIHLQFLGHPITNDPLYNDLVWGPEKGKNGVYHKTDQQLYEDLVKHHTETLFEISEPQSHEGKEKPSDPASLTSHELRLTPDPNCTYCQKNFKDPNPDQLVMYLHALSYKGPGWEYHTDVPLWAQNHGTG